MINIPIPANIITGHWRWSTVVAYERKTWRWVEFRFVFVLEWFSASGLSTRRVFWSAPKWSLHNHHHLNKPADWVICSYGQTLCKSSHPVSEYFWVSSYLVVTMELLNINYTGSSLSWRQEGSIIQFREKDAGMSSICKWEGRTMAAREGGVVSHMPRPIKMGRNLFNCFSAPRN